MKPKEFGWKYGKIFKKFKPGDRINFFKADKTQEDDDYVRPIIEFYCSGILVAKTRYESNYTLIIITKDGSFRKLTIPVNACKNLRLPILYNRKNCEDDIWNNSYVDSFSVSMKSSPNKSEFRIDSEKSSM